MRRIPADGINLFHLIYILLREYTEKSGLPALNLSLGNPDGIPEGKIRALKSRYARDAAFEYHTYAEETDLHDFAEGMVELHGRIRPKEFPHLRAIPIPGIKTASALIPLACGLHLPDAKRRAGFKVASNLPAYDVIGTWARSYLAAERIVWPLAAADGMKLNLERLKAALKERKASRADLVFVIRPGNPSSVAASKAEWEALIEFCIENDTRLVNDAAYTGLADERHSPLACVAKDYPALEWLELYSVSKSFSDPGARLGAMVGSKDFVEDFIMIKGNSESGPVPSVMAAYGTFFSDRQIARASMEKLRKMYQKRLDYLIPRLKKAGFQQACPTEAGFFTLWKTPRGVLGRVLGKSLPIHEDFNRTVISETGIVGVHFMGPAIDGKQAPLVRYAVCTDVLDKTFQERFEEQLARLKPEY